MRGCTGEAAAALGALNKLRRPFRSLDYERSLARAWVAASQGAINLAITIVQSAAETAAANGRFAAEVTACRRPHSSGFTPVRPACANLKRS